MEAYTLSDRSIINSVLEAFRRKPKQVVAQDTLRAQFYREWCWRYIYAMFKFDIPKEWDYEYFLEGILSGSGLLGVSDTTAGVIALRCSGSGVNIYNHATHLIFANPVLGSWKREIDVDCVPLFLDGKTLQTQNSPINIVVSYFAESLAQCDGTISQNLMNSRIGAIVECEDKREAQTAKAVMDAFYNGEPVAFTKAGMYNKINILQARNTYVSNEIQDLKRAIKNDFFSMFGYNNTNYNKKARQTVSEVDANNGEVMGGITYWLECCRKQLDAANKMFGLNLSVSMRPWTEVVEEIGEGDNIE